MPPGETLLSTWDLVHLEWEWELDSTLLEWEWVLVLLAWGWGWASVLSDSAYMIPLSTLGGVGDLDGVIQCSITSEAASTIPFGEVDNLAHLGAGEDQSWQQGQSSFSQEANLVIVALSTAQDLAEVLPSQMALAD